MNYCHRYLTGILFILLSQGGVEAYSRFNAKNDSLALSCFKNGETFAHKGDTARAINEFNEALRFNHRLSSAYHRLAQLHIGLGTLEDRAQAEHYLDQALYYEPKNETYLNTRLKLYLKIEFDGGAEQILKKLLKINPKNAEAYFHLGYLEEKQWLKYHDMINPHKNDIVFSFKKFADKDIGRAVKYYRKAIECDPHFSNAYFRLALLYYETDELDTMASLIKKALHHQPENKNYYLFQGLAYHRMRRFREAAEAFSMAKSLMPSDELTLFESVDLLTTPKQDMAIRRTSNIREINAFEKAFWKSKDPLFLTETNERKLEHYCRVAYANLRFSKPFLKDVWEGVEGWESDMGKVYIRYGPPESQLKIWGAFGDFTIDLRDPWATAKGKMPANTAVWNYPDFKFWFRDVDGFQHYKFKWGVEEPDYLDFYQRLKRNIPERYEFTSPEQQLKIACVPACFTNSETHSILESYHSLPKESITTEDSTLRRGVFVFDQHFREIQKVVRDHPPITEYADSLVLGWERVLARFGNILLAVEYLNDKTGKMGRWMREITIPAYMKSRLEMSDLVMAWEVGDYREKGELRKGGQRIVPNILGVYADSELIPFYFEVYNLTYTSEGSTRYRITTTVESIEKDIKSSIKSVVDRILGIDEKTGSVVTSFDYQGSNRMESMFQNLTLEDPRPIRYRLIVEIEDLNTGEKATAQREFTLMH